MYSMSLFNIDKFTTFLGRKPLIEFIQGNSKIEKNDIFYLQHHDNNQ